MAGLELATVRVATTSASTLCPQVAQKRLFSAISLSQDGHLVMADASHDRIRAIQWAVIQLAE